MKKTVLLNVILGMTVVLVLGGPALSHAIHETMPAETIVALPGPYADSLYKYITKEDSYREWNLWPGKEKLYKGTQPHGEYLTTYVNDNALYSIKAWGKMANGSIIVKENYSAEKVLNAITVMYKIKKYNPGGGDWFWAKYDARGKELTSGKVDACIKCHSEKKKNDYIFTGEFVK